MSIEKQLHQHFHRRAEKLACPVEIDEKVQKSLQSHIRINDSNKLKFPSRRFPSFVIIAVVIVLLCGFAFASTQLLFKAGEENVSYEMYADSTLTPQNITGKEIRESLNYVKSQLATGETAVVYLSDFAKERHPLIQQYPLLSVTNPYVETNYANWENTLALTWSDYKLPVNLPDTYTFVGGKSGYPLVNSIISSEVDAQFTDSLKKEAKETDAKLVWKKTIPGLSPITAYTTIYRHNNGDEVYITMELFPEDLIKVESFTNEAIANESIKIGGNDAFYTNNKNFFSDTEQYQDLFWMEGINGKTIVYRIGTTSLIISKDDLILIANQMN